MRSSFKKRIYFLKNLLSISKIAKLGKRKAMQALLQCKISGSFRQFLFFGQFLFSGLKKRKSFESWAIYLIMKLNLLLSTCLKIMMSMIIEMKCKKCPGICKQCEPFVEIICINSLNTVKLVHNAHLWFLKRVCKSQVFR